MPSAELPVLNFTEQIKKAIAKNDITVIQGLKIIKKKSTIQQTKLISTFHCLLHHCLLFTFLTAGETGCGKSTKVPQFILQDNPQ